MSSYELCSWYRSSALATPGASILKQKGVEDLKHWNHPFTCGQVARQHAGSRYIKIHVFKTSSDSVLPLLPNHPLPSPSIPFHSAPDSAPSGPNRADPAAANAASPWAVHRSKEPSALQLGPWRSAAASDLRYLSGSVISCDLCIAIHSLYEFMP